MRPGDVLTLRVEKPAAGGRMIARHEGRVVLVQGAIPGEVVRARVERATGSLAFATVVDTPDPHPARRSVSFDPRCGGAVFAHIAYDHQVALKARIIEDALTRIAGIPPTGPVLVEASPERGYRMRARLHIREGRIGFFLEGTHRLCDAGATGQLLESTWPVLVELARRVRRAGLRGDADVELSENIPGDQRAVHIDLDPGASLRHPGGWEPVQGLTGVTWAERGRGPVRHIVGDPLVTDVLRAADRDAAAPSVRLQRQARAFFQANRFLLEPLVRRVCSLCPPGVVLDLYAGVGLFGAMLAASGRHRVTAVEGHRAAVDDLRRNAAAWGDALTVVASPVEAFLRDATPSHPCTVVLDPPRSGMTKDALAGVLAIRPERVVFVSCDVATFARDVRRFVEAGYALEHVEGFDLFPNTAHVEAVGVLAAGPRP